MVTYAQARDHFRSSESHLYDPTFIVGIVLAVVMYMLRAKFPCFMFTPIGLIMAITLKWLTFKVGGTTLYEKKEVPIAVGLITGFGLNFAFTCLLSVMRNMGTLIIP